MAEPQPLGDHPHNDPGDGRTECQTCGKWVWLVTHSCKGIPVTMAARARADTPPPSTTPAASVRLSAEEREALNRCPHCRGPVYQHNDLGRTVNKTVCGLSLQEARVAAVERILTDRAQPTAPDLPDDSLAMALADLDRAERRLAAVEALVGKWEASAVEAESIAQARIGIADVMDYLVAAVVRRQCARDLNTALTADQPTTGGDEAGL